MSWGAQNRPIDAKTPSAALGMSAKTKLELCGIQPYLIFGIHLNRIMKARHPCELRIWETRADVIFGYGIGSQVTHVPRRKPARLCIFSLETNNCLGTTILPNIDSHRLVSCGAGEPLSLNNSRVGLVCV
jgi:hypothetical protein